MALNESTSVPAARKVLALLWLDDVRQAALQLLDELERGYHEAPTAGGDRGKLAS